MSQVLEFSGYCSEISSNTLSKNSNESVQIETKMLPQSRLSDVIT